MEQTSLKIIGREVIIVIGNTWLGNYLISVDLHICEAWHL